MAQPSTTNPYFNKYYGPAAGPPQVGPFLPQISIPMPSMEQVLPWINPLPALANIFAPNADLAAASRVPQGADESNMGYSLRTGVQGLRDAFSNAWTGPGQAVLGAFQRAAETPNDRVNAARVAPAPYHGSGWSAQPQAPMGLAEALAMAVGQESPATAAVRSNFNPFGSFRSTSGPGDARDGGARVHRGRDWAMPEGTPIVAPQPFQILATGNDARSGNFARVQFADGTVHSFSHLKAKPPIGGGMAGDPIALSGRSGNATGPSVHVRSWGPDGQEIADPQSYFSGGGGIMDRMGQIAGNFGMAPPAFDTSGFDAARSGIAAASRASTEPFSATYTEQPRPERPAAEAFTAPDFSASDKAFELAKPEAPFADKKDVLKTERQYYFRGLAAALGSLNFSDGVGLGELFAKLGAGALGGRLEGDEFIREKREEYDKNLRQYQVALANRDQQKAITLAEVNNRNVEQRNAYNNAKFSDNLSEWARTLNGIRDGKLYTRSVKDGKVTETVTPIDPSLRAPYFLRMGEVGMQQGNAQNSYNMQIYGAMREDARTALAFSLTDPSATPQQRNQAALVELADRASSVIGSGSWESMVPPDEAQQLKAQAAAAAGMQYNPKMGLFSGAGGTPSSEQLQTYQRFLQSKLLEMVVNGGPASIKQFYDSSNWSYMGQQLENRRTTTRRDAMGRTTSSVTQAFGAQ